MRYIPNTPDDRSQMLRTIGVDQVSDLFADIPEQVRLKAPLQIPPAQAELDLVREMQAMAEQNADLDHYACFLGAGAYDHFVPTLVRHLISRNEFYTAYTPYQPEISQGTLQAIYEYQSLICTLTGLDIANASMYDGASALAEAAIMTVAAKERDVVLVSRSVHPDSRSVMRTYLAGQGIEVREVPLKNGVTDLAALEELLAAGNVSGVLVQHPNFFGCLEPVQQIAALAHKADALFAVSADPISLGVLQPPGAYDADIAVGEGQVLGNALSFGGPYLGYLAARETLARRIPGRIAGVTVDTHGQRAFVLTLQTREQHIRREKATSNICTNQALNALAATVYLTTMGKQGIQDVARQCVAKSHYALNRLREAAGAEPVFPGVPFFREFAVRPPVEPEVLNRRLLEHHLIGGFDLGRAYPELAGAWLVAVTEKRTRAEIDILAGQVVAAQAGAANAAARAEAAGLGAAIRRGKA